MRHLRAAVLVLAAACLLTLGGPAPGKALGAALPLRPLPVRAEPAGHGDVTQGALRITRGDEVVECPLRRTDVRVEVSGFIARVRVTQTFENPSPEPIEAVYVFPLPHGAAVDAMTMDVGGRRIAGVVKRRRQARAVYDQAVRSGQTASLLEQERPNVFTQSVGNVPPGQQVRVEIAYVDVLAYEGGRYDFHFPMVVGPRYVPAGVSDAARITPPVLPPGFRTGHDVSLSMQIEAGVPLRDLQVHNHQARVERTGSSRARVVLSAEDHIPNKDFVLSYVVAGERPEVALLSHAAPGGDGTFLLMLQPREMDAALQKSPPRDVCFLIDVSGSMSGEPMARVIDAMERFVERMRPQDRMQVVTFAGAARTLFPGYVPASPANVETALAFTRAMQGGGGTEMLQGIRTVLADPVDPERVRIVVMLTDGFIGNEDAIIGEVGRHAGDQLRFWTVGIGSSPNRHLLDGVARQGGGASSVLGLHDATAPLVDRIMDRIQRAQLSRVAVDWGGVEVYETYPARIGELWAGRPVFLLGRYRGAGAARLTLTGRAEGEPVSFEVGADFAEPSAGEGGHAVLATAWARKKIEALGDQMAVAGESEELAEEVTLLALEHHLMSAYTSLVAVDARVPDVEPAAPPRRILVPLPMPDGVSYEGIFGRGGGKGEVDGQYAAANAAPVLTVMAPAPSLPATRAYTEPKLAKRRPASRGDHAGTIGMAGAAAREEVVDKDGRRQVLREGLVSARAQAQQHQAQAALDEAARLRAEKRTEAAARALTLAANVEQARLREGGAGTGTLAHVLAELAAVAREREDEAAVQLPALGRPLALVVRNADLAAALQDVARAARVKIVVEAGTMEQVHVALGAQGTRVGYLDLRGVPAARALTWLTQPAGLVWRLAGGGVRVSSAHPPADAPALVSETGRADIHRRQARATIAAWTWPLLAAALHGGVDDAAASELLEAWSVPGVADATAPSPLLLRSLWSIAVARQARGGDPTLQRLWEVALAAARPAAAPATVDPAAGAYAALLRGMGVQGLAPSAAGPAGPTALRGRSGDDAFVLTALALRRQGGEDWARFREAMAEHARRAGASGGALRVANRLEGARGVPAALPVE
jgi:Ca-activated chloride channel homolog